MRRPGPGAGEPGGQPRSPSHRTNQACLSCRGQCGGDGVPRVGSGPHGPGKACPSLDRVQSPGLRGSELALHPGPGHTSSGPPGSQDRGQQSREGRGAEALGGLLPLPALHQGSEVSVAWWATQT